MDNERSSKEWKNKFSQQTTDSHFNTAASTPPTNTIRNALLRQIIVMLQRNMQILFNDRIRFLLLSLQAPLLGFLISLVADGNQFEAFSITRSLLFALSCSAFWMGISNSIQEVCKEKNILKREYMTGMRLDAYISSKMLTMFLLCLAQSFLLSIVFAWRIGMPEQGVLSDNAYLEFFITTFLTAFSASSMGIFVSSLFNNADRAMTVAPLLLMPQLLFAGLIFKLSGVSEWISVFVVCRWAMEGFGTTANLNALDLITEQGVVVPHAYESFYDYSASHMYSTWAILLAFTLVLSILSGFILKGINKKS
jgi:hypothetical protein